MLCDTSVDPKSTGKSLAQHLVLSSLRALCAGSLGRRRLRGDLSDKIRGLPGVGPKGCRELIAQLRVTRSGSRPGAPWRSWP